MVFCSCRKTSTNVKHSSSSSSSSSKNRRGFSSLFSRKQPLAYITADLDDDDSPPYTDAELKRFEATKKSKAHVDGVFYRNRKSGRRTLLTRDGVVMFSGFIDWFNRKMLREKKLKGERYGGDDDVEEGAAASTPMMMRVQRIDPVKSGFMGKKADRDGTLGVAAGVLVPEWKPPPKELVVTPQKVDDVGYTSGCSPMMMGSVTNNESFATAATEDVWCDVFNSSISTTEELNISSSSNPEMETIEDYSGNVAASTDDEAVWCDVFHSSTILPEGEEGEAVVTNDEDKNKGREEKSSSAKKIRGIQNVEVVFSDEKRSMFKRFSTRKKKKEDSYKQLQ